MKLKKVKNIRTFSLFSQKVLRTMKMLEFQKPLNDFYWFLYKKEYIGSKLTPSVSNVGAVLLEIFLFFC